MRNYVIVLLAALSLITLPAFADDMAGMSMGDMSSMHHDHGDAAAANQTSPADYHSHGVLKRYHNGQVAIAHQAIPALSWPPMTMTFNVPPELKNIIPAIGAQVDFSFRQEGQSYRLTAIHPKQP